MQFTRVSVPDYEERNDRVDTWWVKVFALIEKERASPPMELMKLVKMMLVLAHSQGWVERGFNISKMFAMTEKACLFRVSRL